MQIIPFDRDLAQAIVTYDSQNVAFRRIAAQIPNCHIGIMYIAPGGLVGYHQAVGDQLFMVVQGSGWVTSTDRQRTNISVCQAAFWDDGEWHESGSDVGMTAVVIEAESLSSRLNAPYQ